MNIYIGKPIVVSDMQGPCPDGFHVPLYTEWTGLNTIMDGLGLSYANSARMGIYLHMPMAGSRGKDSSIGYQGVRGSYWSSSPRGDSYTSSSFSFSFATNSTSILGRLRGSAASIRGFKDEFVVPTSSWTVITGTLGGAGIFYNTADGIISITSDGTTGYTIMDKNLGATAVYNNGDTLSQANCGYYYQWGNNFGFAWTGSVTTSSTQVNAQNYGPGNYYESDTYITGNDDWSSVTNDNLRGGVSQGSGTKSVEVQNIYIGEKPYEGPLRFTANTAGSTISLKKTGSPTSVTLETSTDGSTWTTYTFGTIITLSNIGDKVYWRNAGTTGVAFYMDGSNYYRFVMTGSIAGSGDINYLLSKDSTTTLPDKCYQSLFNGCTSLTSSPYLPSTTLSSCCYQSMFYGCTSLKNCPQLPATTLAEQCYQTMFGGCTSLTTTPSLPATTLANYCYRYMFNGCTNLTTLSNLSATNLQQYCYQYMFRNCSKIKLSTTQTGGYQTSYRIPTTGTGTTGTNSLQYMFDGTGGTFTGTPSINTTYYTSNEVIS